MDGSTKNWQELVTDCGLLAARAWDSDKLGNKRVLLLHDLFDNSCVFDLLVPELQHQNGLHIVALDLPGHGRSHGLPVGSMYLDTTMVYNIRKFVKYIGWHQTDATDQQKVALDNANDKFTIIGHGEGAGLALFYARLFPHDVEQIISLDFVRLKKSECRNLLIDTATKIEQSVDIKMSLVRKKKDGVKSQPSESALGQDSNSNYKSIPYEDGIRMIVANCSAPGDLSAEQASLLVRRENQSPSVSSKDNCIIIKKDYRLCNYINVRDFVEPTANNSTVGLQCHLLVILARNGRHKDGNDLDDLDAVVEDYKKNCASFELTWLEESDHFFPIKKMKETAKIINEALKVEC